MLKPGSWPCIILLIIYGTVATSLVTQAVPVIVDIERHFGIPHSTAGWVISIPSAITALFAMFGGWLIDRVGDKRVIFIGSLCALFGNLGVFFADNLVMLFGSRLLEGIGYLSLTVGTVTLIMRTTSGARRATAMGLWTAHTAAGIGLTLSLVAPLAHNGELWRWAFGGHAVLMALLVLAVPLLPGKIGNETARKLSDIWVVVRSPRPYRVALASAASAFIQTGIMAALTVYLTKTFSVSVGTAAGVGTLGEVFVILSCFAVGHLLRAGWSPRSIALLGGAVTLGGGIAFYLPSASFTEAAVALCVFSAGIGLVNALIWTQVPLAAPSTATMGATSGLVAQFTYLGVLLGPPAIFSSFHGDGWATRIGLVVAAGVLQLAMLPIWRRRYTDASAAGHVPATGGH